MLIPVGFVPTQQIEPAVNGDTNDWLVDAVNVILPLPSNTPNKRVLNETLVLPLLELLLSLMLFKLLYLVSNNKEVLLEFCNTMFGVVPTNELSAVFTLSTIEIFLFGNNVILWIYNLYVLAEVLRIS